MNPAGYFPILKSENGLPIVGPSVIMEYLEESYERNSLFNKKFNSEIRRLVFWFENTFKQDIIFPILNEKIYKRFNENKNPDSNVLRKSIENMKFHLNYFNIMVGENEWLAGDKISYADIYFAANMSVLDYIDELNFQGFNEIKEVYYKVKSRPSFKKILIDRIVGISPGKNYKNFDY
jgi:Glutathione S-transferase